MGRGQGAEGVKGLSKKEKGLMDMDNSVVIVGWRESISRLKGNVKKDYIYK